MPVWQWLVIAIVFSWLIPAGIILKRLGYSPLLVVIAAVPLFALIGIWVLAFLKWPITRFGEPIEAPVELA